MNAKLREYLAAPPFVRDAFDERVRRHAEGVNAESEWLCDYDPPRVEPRPPVKWGKHWSRRARGDTSDCDDLKAIPAEEYVARLTGEEGNRLACPFPDHDDSLPSFWVYRGDRGWYCHGCNRSGDIFDFAGYLWGIEARGPAFVQIKDELEAVFG